jgi:2-polyprenyl-6-hydroxyphenyl methylase/3-demethylubiquinone-9 3-methyltransferase
VPLPPESSKGATMTINADQSELEKFSQLAHRWWDPGSDFKPLHDINPLRLDWIDGRCGLAGKRVLDVGCGGGLLAEGMCERGATVTGIDLSDKALSVARLHLLESGTQRRLSQDRGRRTGGRVRRQLRRRHLHGNARARSRSGEHVAACAALVRPGGHVFFSTINRNPKAYLLAVIGAEYVLRMLPRGTHDYARFIKPSELATLGEAGRPRGRELRGMSYNPLTAATRWAAIATSITCCILVKDV